MTLERRRELVAWANESDAVVLEDAIARDLRFEGENVDRHLDLTTSNHASFPGGPPTNALETQMEADVNLGICPCCKKAAHSAGQPMNADQWYEHRADREGDTKHKDAKVTKKGVVKEPERHAKSIPAKKAEAQAKNVEDAFGAMNRAAIVCKANILHLLAKRCSQPKHRYQFGRLIFSCSCHYFSPSTRSTVMRPNNV